MPLPSPFPRRCRVLVRCFRRLRLAVGYVYALAASAPILFPFTPPSSPSLPLPSPLSSLASCFNRHHRFIVAYAIATIQPASNIYHSSFTFVFSLAFASVASVIAILTSTFLPMIASVSVQPVQLWVYDMPADALVTPLTPTRTWPEAPSAPAWTGLDADACWVNIHARLGFTPGHLGFNHVKWNV